MSVSYPQYRKYKNNKSYFKIISANEFEEIQVLSSSNKLYSFKASILPDRNYIYDLTHQYQEFADVISSTDYEKVKAKCV